MKKKADIVKDMVKMEEGLKKVKIFVDVVKKLLDNEKTYLASINTIKAETVYTYKGVIKLVKEDDYERLFKNVIKHHKEFLEIMEELEKLK